MKIGASLLLLSILYCATIRAAPIKDTTIIPAVGIRCPDFLLEAENSSKKKVTLDDFKGKWLILDFWSSYCSACMQNFPKTNHLQEQFKDKAQVLLIGYDDDRIRPIFQRFQQKENLDLPCAYDTSLFIYFDIAALPFTVYIDPTGIVRGITGSPSAETLEAFLSGESPILPKMHFHHSPPGSFDQYAPFLVNNNGGKDDDFIYRSVLSRWDTAMPFSELNPNLDVCINVLKHKGFQLIGTDVRTLYQYAYLGKSGYSFGDSLYGKVYSRPTLEVIDSSVFGYDYSTRKGLYCYSLNFPISKADRTTVMKMMQTDLERYFGYSATFETKMMPYWKLVVSKDGKERLLTKSHTKYFSGLPHIGFIAKDIPLISVLGQISADHQDEIFLDETGISGNIDIDLHDCFFPDLNDVRRALRQNGLDLVRAERSMRVLIIRDEK